MRALAGALDGATAVLALAFLAALAGPLRVRPEATVVAAAVTIGLRALVKPYPRPEIAPRTLVAGAAVAYVAVLGFITVTRHLAFRTHALDLGYYVQVVWRLGRGEGARVTVPPMHAWGDHFSPVLYLFAPLGRLTPGAIPLLLAQTVILAAGAGAVFALARRRLADGAIAAGFAVLYLSNPSLHGINLRDVHPAAFAIPLVLAAAAAADAGRWGWCAAALLATLASREDAAVAVAGFGVWLALAAGRRLAGAALVAGCVAVLWVDLNVVLPYFRGEPYPHLHRYERLGSSLPEILVSLVLPWRWLGLLLDGGRLVYVAAMLAPLAFLPLLAPRALAAAVPGLAMNVLSNDPILFHHRTQYQAFVLPFLLLAALDGAAHLGRRGARITPAAAVTAALVASLALTSRTFNDLAAARWRWGPETRALAGFVRAVPADAAVSVNERVQPHLAARAESYVYPLGLERSAWVIELDAALARRPAPGFERVARAAGWTLLRRGPG